MARKEKEVYGLRQPRDAKGRFVKKVIKPLPINMKPQISKWSTEDEDEDDFEDDCKCGCCQCTTKSLEPLTAKFKRLQGKLNPKKECKDVFEEAHRYLIATGGMLSKVIDRTTNKPFGFLVRIPSTTNPDVVYMRFIKYNPYNPNTYFQKANAIVSTMICGERWLEKRNKREEWIDDIPFEVYYECTHNVIDVGQFGTLTCIETPTCMHYVQGRWMNEAEREGYVITKEMMAYFDKFEQKARDYYKNNGKNKKFIALPFT